MSLPPVTAAAAAPTATPLPLRIPPTFRVTPAPAPVPGVVSYPRIAGDSSRGEIRKNYTFPFQDRAVTITASVNKSVYNGAKNGEKTVVTDRKDIDKRAWAPGYFLAFINDCRQEAFYTSLLLSFRNVRQEMGLSDDEYLELMAVFVQSLEYDTAAARNLDSGNRFPVETFVDGKGVCGDKSMLLAGLLSREGYDVALLLFEQEKHMALGIRSGRNQYRNTSYAFLETTRLTLAGEVPDKLAGGVVLTSMPQVIPVGNGWKEYFATPQTMSIRNQSRILRERIEAIESRLGEPVPDIQQYNALVEEHNRYVVHYNYINGHEYDRPGTYRYIMANESPSSGDSGTVPQPSPSAPAFAVCSPAANLSCPAGSRCCEADLTCYAPCGNGTWDQKACACR